MLNKTNFIDFKFFVSVQFTQFCFLLNSLQFISLQGNGWNGVSNFDPSVPTSGGPVGLFHPVELKLLWNRNVLVDTMCCSQYDLGVDEWTAANIRTDNTAVRFAGFVYHCHHPRELPVLRLIVVVVGDAESDALGITFAARANIDSCPLGWLRKSDILCLAARLQVRTPTKARPTKQR